MYGSINKYMYIIGTENDYDHHELIAITII